MVLARRILADGCSSLDIFLFFRMALRWAAAFALALAFYIQFIKGSNPTEQNMTYVTSPFRPPQWLSH